MLTQMNMENKIMTCQTSTNIVDLTQGVIYGLHLLSKDSTYLSEETFNDLCMSVTATTKWEKSFFKTLDLKEFKKRVKKEMGKKWDKNGIPGKVMFSVILPKYYNTDTVKIRNGIMLEGELNKSSMNRIVQEIYINFGKQDAINYINGANFLCNRWNTMYGFSFGLNDCLNTKEDEIKETLRKTEEEVAYINSMLKTDAEKEIMIKEVLSAATQVGQRISKNGMVGGENNAMAISTRSKAKGSYVNLCYISCFLGLQTVLGNRYEPQLCEGTRTLACFDRNDLSPKSRGFVSSNFYEGLDPAALFFHSWSARKGLIDTAVTTRTSGYSHRQFGKKMENARLDQYGTIRDCDGSIIDFCYGEFGFDAAEVYWVHGLPFFMASHFIMIFKHSLKGSTHSLRKRGERQINLSSMTNI